jgi:hypothetical protein
MGTADSSGQKTPAVEAVVFDRSVAAGEGWNAQCFVAVSQPVRTESGSVQRSVTYRVAFSGPANAGTPRISSCEFVEAESAASQPGTAWLGVPNQPDARWRITTMIKPANGNWASVADDDDIEIIATVTVDD